MRKLLALMVPGLLLFGIAGFAGAAPMNWVGTSTILLADYPPGVITGGGVATINSSDGVIPAHLSTLRLAASRGQIHGTFIRYVTDPEVFGNGIFALDYQGVGGLTGTNDQISGAVASTLTPAGGILPQEGYVKLCLLSSLCGTWIDLYVNQPTINGGTQGVGVGGLLTAGGYGGIRISLQCAPWTVKTTTVIEQITPAFTPPAPPPPKEFITWVAKGWAHGPNSNTTTTAAPSGVVQLVTASQVVTNLPFGSSAKMGQLVITVIHFIPEPGLLLLFGSGVAGLALLGRMRMRK